MEHTTFITVFTPTYNRKQTIHRVYDSLINQTYKNFEWLIVDDGSTDGTKDLIDNYKAQSPFPIRYYYQENAGKHNAVNKAVALAKGEMFIIADSDDSFIPESFEVFIKYWSEATDEERKKLKGISCRCIEENGTLIGDKDVPEPYLDKSELEAKFVEHFNYEMWGMLRTDVLREFPFPAVKGLRYFPESVVWDRIARKYETRYINKGLRIYYSDQGNATTNHKSVSRARENYYLWLHYLNEVYDYLKYDRMLLFKSAVGIVRDGLVSGRSMKDILSDVELTKVRILVISLSPAGFILSGKFRKD